jgi:leader peptidase (prepilin peptidase)/N-methyltransferase
MPVGGNWWQYCLASAGAGAILAWRLPHASTSQRLVLGAWLAFAVAGVILGAIDIQVRRLPTPIIVVAAAVDTPLVAAATIAAGGTRMFGAAALCGVVVGAAYLVLALAVPSGLGLGDVRLAALAGLLLGAESWNAVVLGAIGPFLLGAPVAGVLLALRRIDRDTAIPFGVLLVAGAILAVAIMP